MRSLRWVFGAALLERLLYPFFNSPLEHLYSDPARHWHNALRFLDPDVLASGDPYCYQLWLFLLQRLAGASSTTAASTPGILLGCGLLCAAMPYGWYRALRELLPVQWALSGALIIALVPATLGIYGYFMNETLLLSLTGFAFWLTLRAWRKGSVPAFAWASLLWLAAGFTRVVLWPAAVLALGWSGLAGPRPWYKLASGAALLALFAVPAGLHCRAALGFFSPMGNLYLNEIYRDSGNKLIELDFGPEGRYEFGSPSFYNPTFYPFSDWTTGRTGAIRVSIDTREGRRPWVRARAQARAARRFSRLTDAWENLLYLGAGQPWPQNDPRTLVGTLSIWTRWLWPPLFVVVAAGALRRVFSGREWLLPASGLLMLVLLAVQQQGIMEARFRMPVDPILLAALVVMIHRRRAQRAMREVPA
ncbi:MAG TPA: hypothetical protein VN859_02620 [Steroidobacteraceae bacterium]|nr:hypothetical protein [Steroidobacteraceae bacterium]